MTALFRIESPGETDLDRFHKDGYVAFPDVFTDEARDGFIDEMLNLEPVVEFFNKSAAELRSLGKSYRLSVKPWNEKGPWSDKLLDAPLVRALLGAVIGRRYHFCHSSLAVSLPGAGGIQFHQDHHHWFHDSPGVLKRLLSQRDRWYIQMLYYPNGFQRGDASLSILPGSHRASPLEFPAERLAEGDFGPFEPRELELPPGSMVLLNARVFHGVSPKLENSPQKYRLFSNYIFKEAAPPHLNTQEIPCQWVRGATDHRRQIFLRRPYSPGCWEDGLSHDE